MALAVNGSGTIFKKCDRSNHRPDSNKGCASSTCQHTCDPPERCQHAWALRYWVNGKQVEKSFKDKPHPTTGESSRHSPGRPAPSAVAGGAYMRTWFRPASLARY